MVSLVLRLVRRLIDLLLEGTFGYFSGLGIDHIRIFTDIWNVLQPQCVVENDYEVIDTVTWQLL
jgi:hypothetical protein